MFDMRLSSIDQCQHILSVARPLIVTRGFTAVGLAELLAAAQVPKGSFYHYFDSKEAFGVALLNWYFDDQLARLDELLSRRCAQVCTVLFLPRAVLLTVLVSDRRDFPASRRQVAGGSARRHRQARHG